MTCQQALWPWIPGIPIPAPSSVRRLSHLSRLDVQECLHVWVDLIRADPQRGASIEDAYRVMAAEPETLTRRDGLRYSPFGPEVESRLRTYIDRERCGWRPILWVPSSRPSRRGAMVAVWGVRE